MPVINNDMPAVAFAKAILPASPAAAVAGINLLIIDFGKPVPKTPFKIFPAIAIELKDAITLLKLACPLAILSYNALKAELIDKSELAALVALVSIWLQSFGILAGGKFRIASASFLAPPRVRANSCNFSFANP